LNAIYLELVREEDGARREALKAGALTLADYQADVGTEPLGMLGISVEEMSQPPQNDDERKALAERIANNPNRERYKAYKTMADEEIVTIQANLTASEQMRQQMPDDKKREILG